ncbi:MAG: gas vesicle protein GvpG [Nocardioides sp.]|jgi:gas vesicle protein GvpG
MGLITGLFTWPVAPVRGVAWIADQVLDEAERQWADPAAVERALADVDEKRRSGELSEEEAEELEEELVARLIHDQGGPHG